MSLRTDRSHLDSLIDFHMTSTATRGGIVCQNTAGSGAAMDQSSQVAAYVAAPSGEAPLGVLMCDVVNEDRTRQHQNWYKEQVDINGKVTIWSKCVVVTDFVYPGQTPTAGQRAYVLHSGYVGNSDFIGGNLVVGRWLSTKDEDGFAKLSVNLPNN